MEPTAAPSSGMASPPPAVLNTINAIRLSEIIKEGDYEKLLSFFQKSNDNIRNYHSSMGNLLHLAVMFGCKSLLEALLTHNINVNACNADGNTPLHLAAKLGRQDIVDCLLEMDGIDDTIVNEDGYTALEVAKTRQIANTIEYLRKLYISKQTKQMFDIIAHREVSLLKKVFESQRNRNLLDLNSQDPHGNTILHLAAKRDSMEGVQLCLELGVDPFAKNGKGKLALELTKDDKIKHLLREAPMTRSRELPIGKTEVKMDGTLLKWTNYAGGYKKRWFVLEEGIISYYKSQYDYPVSCRGSINMKFADVIVDPSDKFRFDVVSSNLKFCLRAEHAGDAKRWIMALFQAKKLIDKESGPFVNTARKSQMNLDGNERVISDVASATNPDGMPYNDFIQSILQTAMSHLEANDSLINSMRSYLAGVNDEGAAKVAQEYYQTASSISSSLKECIVLCEEREKFWKYKLEKEAQRKRIFEESLQVLAKENNELEEFTKEQAEQLSVCEEDEFFDAYDMQQASVAELSLEESDINFVKTSLIGYKESRRSILPYKSTNIPSISLWSVLKNAIGKDLTKLPVPVNFNEPLSMLQRLCEDMEYTELLERAYDEKDPLKRIQFVAAFAMSNYSSTDGRTTKPFNPLLGETFEYVNSVYGYRYISEQVSHHPPISACYCESKRFVFWSEVKAKTRFWGKSLEIVPLGVSHLLIKDPNGGPAEHFTWKKVTTQVNNIIIGKLWIDHYGEMKVTNHRTGDVCVINFKPTGWRSGNARKLEGFVKDRTERFHYELFGFWHQYLKSRPVSNSSSTAGDLDADSFVVWSRHPILPQSAEYFNYTAFTFELNEICPSLAERICPTDSRFRPDQRFMESGDLHMANETKSALENKQRLNSKMLIKDNPSYEHRARWFHKEMDKDTDEEMWVYNGGYWECRDAGRWPEDIPNIFLDEEEGSEQSSSKGTVGPRSKTPVNSTPLNSTPLNSSNDSMSSE